MRWSSTMRRFMGPFFRLLGDRVVSFGDGGELAGQFTRVDRLQKVGIAPGSQDGGLRIFFGIEGDSDDGDVARVVVGLELTASTTNATVRLEVRAMMSWSLNATSRSGRQKRFRTLTTGTIRPCALIIPSTI